MSYISEFESRSSLDGLGCGASCNCGPCKSNFSGLGERYERQEPEAAGRSESLSFYGFAESAAVQSCKPPDPRGVLRLRTIGEPMYLSSRNQFGLVPSTLAVAQTVSVSKEVEMIQKELDRGMRDQNRLTNVVFFARHPERGIRAISKSEPQFNQLRNEWLDIRNRLVIPALQAALRKAVPVQPSSVSCNLPSWLLEYEAMPSKNRCISLSDPEFANNYVDSNIVNSTATVNIEEGKVLTWEVHYRDGRKKLFDPNAVPVFSGPRPNRVSVSLINNYVMKRDGFIYPVYNGTVRYDWVQTPALISMRSQLDVKLKALKQLRLLMYLTATFAGAVAAGGKGLSNIQSISGGSLSPSNMELLEKLIK